MSRSREELLAIVKAWPIETTRVYISNLEEQIGELRELVRDLRSMEKVKQRAIDKKLRESGPRGAT